MPYPRRLYLVPASKGAVPASLAENGARLYQLMKKPGKAAE